MQAEVYDAPAGDDVCTSTAAPHVANGMEGASGVATGSNWAERVESAPYVRAESQQRAEGQPDQATTAMVHDMAEHADQHNDALHDSSAGNNVLYSGTDISDDALDEWILQNLDDAGVRSKRVDVLTAVAKPIQYSHAEVLMTIGNIYDRNVD